MSRIGNRVLTIPEGVSVTVNGNIVSVKGPKGELSTEVNRNITVVVEGNEVKAKALTAFYSKLDLGIVKYHFEVGAGKENFEWVDA